MQEFTREELALFNGKNGKPALVAAFGIVYDVSASFLWMGGRHQVTHLAGNDLSSSLNNAPHGLDVFRKFPIVGLLVEHK
jgi:predicted heme/steroid binding protein